MPRLRKRAALVAVAATLVAIPACSGFAGETDEDAITILLVDQPTTKDMQDVWIPKFEDRTGLDVNVELVPEAGMDAKLATTLSGSDAQYDIVMTGAKNWTTLVASDWIEPLDAKLDDPDLTSASYRDGFSTQLMENIAVDGEQYAMPFQVGGDLLFYNKQLFKKAGLNPNRPPHTMPDVVKTARRLQASGIPQAPFVGRGTRKGDENSFLWLMMWFLNGGRWDTSQDARYDVLTEPPALRATEQYNELMTELAPDGAGNYGFAEAQLAMQQGQAAMWLDAAQLGPALEDEQASNISGDVGYAALSGPGDDYVTGAIWGLSLVAGTDHESDAWKLITYLTGKEVSIEQTVSGANGSPARSDVLDSPEVRSTLNPEFLDALKQTIPHANPNYTPLIAEGTQIRGAISLELSNMLSGAATPQSAMQAANENIAEVMDES